MKNQKQNKTQPIDTARHLDEAFGAKISSVSIVFYMVLFFANYGNLRTSFLLLISSFLVSILILRSKSVHSKFSTLANGNTWVIISFLVIFLISPVILNLTESSLPYVFASQDWNRSYTKVNYLASVALMSLSLGMSLKDKSLRKATEHTPKNFNQNQKTDFLGTNTKSKGFTLSIILITFWLSLYLIWAHSQGSLTTVIFGTRSKYQTANISLSNGYLADSLIGAIGIISVWIILGRKDQKSYRFILYGLYLLLALPALMHGDRSKALYFLIVLLIIFLTTGKKLRKREIIIALLLFPLLVVGPRIWRNTNSVEPSISKSFSTSNMIETFTGGDTAMAPTLAIFLNHAGKDIPYTLGRTYATILSKPIPRFLWESKPLSIDTQLNEQLFPNTARQGIGFSFSAISEPFLNFGIFGVIAFFMLLGRFLHTIYIKIDSRKPTSIMLNAWIAGFIFILMRGNLTTDIQRCVFPLLSGMMILRVINRLALTPNISKKI